MYITNANLCVQELTNPIEMVVEEEESALEDGRESVSPKAEEGEGGESVFFSVGEVRKRLSHHIAAPRRTFERDPQDPSGKLLCSSDPTCVRDYACVPYHCTW